MKLQGEYTFAAPRAVVWEALLDPTVLASVLPGCERLDLVGENDYEGALKIKIGPVQGTFQGKVKLDRKQSAQAPLDGQDYLKAFRWDFASKTARFSVWF